MTSQHLVFLLILLFLKKTDQMQMYKQDSSLLLDEKAIVVNVGHSLTLQCIFNDAKMYFWYKQTSDLRLLLITTFYRYGQNFTLNGEFKDNRRFRLESTGLNNHLKISSVQFSDAATYFCAHSFLHEAIFNHGTTVRVKGSTLNVSVSSSVSASQTLNCTVFTGGCWQEHGDDDKNRKSYCVSIPRSNHHTCLYNQRMKSKDQTRDGFNFCSLASCGHKLFRNTSESNAQVLTAVKNQPVRVYLLGGALAFTIIISLILAFPLFKLNKKSQQFQVLSSPSSPPNTEEEVLHYAALNVHHRSSTGWNQTNFNTECVYSRVNS